MDVTPPQHQDPASGDDELAKVLAGVSDDPNTQLQSPGVAGLQFEETPAPGATSVVSPKANDHKETAAEIPTSTASTSVTEPLEPPVTTSLTAPANGNLETIKKSALEELRPLVDKLTLPPEEKFDTLLLIIRSTDDQSLLQSAHEAAKNITDEAKRAQALLDVIKEIDYFANQPQ